MLEQIIFLVQNVVPNKPDLFVDMAIKVIDPLSPLLGIGLWILLALGLFS